MNGTEIRERIIKLNEVINDNLTPAFFTLNENIKKAQEEINRLREVCPHEYDDLGYCIYCDERKK